jgi:hypothetical protein
MRKMKRVVMECDFPEESIIANEASIANFQDSYMLLSLEKNLDPLAVYLFMVNKVPYWVNSLLYLRNKMMHFVGLKDVGKLGGLKLDDYKDQENRLGAKLDIFTIAISTPIEVVLVLNDKHLDIKLSIMIRKEIDKNNIFVSTVVKFHNFWGKVYMSVITPFHKLIVKRLLQNMDAAFTDPGRNV